MMDSEVIARLKEEIKHYRKIRTYRAEYEVDEVEALIRAAELSEARRRVCEAAKELSEAVGLRLFHDGSVFAESAAIGNLRDVVSDYEEALAALEAEGAGG